MEEYACNEVLKHDDLAFPFDSHSFSSGHTGPRSGFPFVCVIFSASFNSLVEHTKSGSKKSQTKSSSNLQSESDLPVVAYGSLQHGQFITRWNIENGEMFHYMQAMSEAHSQLER